MEDISRELEREIAKSKPKPFRKNRKIKILIVDDFGKVISGNHIKIILMVLFFISIVMICTSAVFFYRFFVSSRDAASYKDRLILAEKKLDELTDEKEVLMARLVILGKEPGIQKKENHGGETSNPQHGTEKEKPVSPPDIVSTGQAATGAIANQIPETKAMNKTVLIEKFAVIRNKLGKDLSVRFDIRNISKDQGDVSGRIFTILKPDSGIENEWLVVPAVALKNGIPSEHKKGQYFSIAHFKPVKFRIKSEIDPDFYKKASIFIFNSEGELIFEKLIDITEVE